MEKRIVIRITGDRGRIETDLTDPVTLMMTLEDCLHQVMTEQFGELKSKLIVTPGN